MAMSDATEEFDGLEAFFRAGRAAAPDPDARLLARIEADALALQQARLAPPPAAVASRPSRWSGLREALGGRRVMAGLVTATLAGLWLGVAQPTQLMALTRPVTQTLLGDSATLDQLDLIPTLDTVLTEG